jgi:hypothetical protein
MKKLIVSFLLFVITVSQNIYAQGCSQCKMAAAQGSELDENSFGSNINGGIAYLMLIPYILIGFLLAFAFREQITTYLKKKFPSLFKNKPVIEQ